MKALVVIQLIGITLVNFALAWSFQQDNLNLTIIYLLVIQAIQVYLFYRTLKKQSEVLLNHLNGLIIKEGQGRLHKSGLFKVDEQIREALNQLSLSLQSVKTEKAMEQQLFTMVLDQIPVGVLLVGENGRIKLSNPAISKLFGIHDIKNIHQLESVSHQLPKRIIRIKQGQATLLKTRVADRNLYVSVTANKFKLLDEQLQLLTLHDIHRELQQEELESWQKLIRVLTHEIMNSIGPITSLSNTLLEHLDEFDHEPADRLTWSATTRTGLEAIRKRGEGLKDFVTAYRQISRVPEPNMSPVRVDKMLEEVLALMDKELATHHINSSLETKGALEWQMDEKQISQVLINLIRNAIHAMRNTKEKILSLSAIQSSDGSLKIIVRDTGEGIAEEYGDKIFIPFFSTHAEGSGIGLNISRQIVQLHNGTLDYRSKPGETVFMICL